jgi:glycine oxidase
VRTAEAAQVDVIVVGAGIVGLGAAWALAESGRSVCVVDPDPAQGATFAAAGMLAAVSELHYQEDELLRLMLSSAARYPQFIESLPGGAAETGFRETETLVVGADSGDRQALTDLHAVQQRHGLDVAQLSVREVRRREQLLSPDLSCAFAVADDHQVDPRMLAAHLLAAFGTRAGGRTSLIRATAMELLHEDDDLDSRVIGVALDDGTRLLAQEVIVANALGAGRLAGLPSSLTLPLRPVYGDILRLRIPDRLRPLLTATVRGLVRGVPVYLVPRMDGTVVVGATSREDGSPGVSAGGTYQLLRDAQILVPAVAELELLETTARARPATPDNAPLLGRATAAQGGPVPGLVLATGFYRHGVLLTPIAADICRRIIEGDDVPDAHCFRPDRFSSPTRKEPS